MGVVNKHERQQEGSHIELEALDPGADRIRTGYRRSRVGSNADRWGIIRQDRIVEDKKMDCHHRQGWLNEQHRRSDQRGHYHIFRSCRQAHSEN